MPDLVDEQEIKKIACNQCPFSRAGVVGACAKSGRRCYDHFARGVACPEGRYAVTPLESPTDDLATPSTGIVQSVQRDFFSRAYVISLERTPKRLNSFIEKWPLDWPFSAWPEHWKAVDGTKVKAKPGWKGGGPAFGCYGSWMGILDRLITDRVEGPVLVMEDDCEWVGAEIIGLRETLSRLPADWELLFIGGQHFIKPVPVVEGIVRCREAGRTHCIAIHPRYFVGLRDFWSDWNTHVDHGLQKLAKTNPARKFYALSPFVAVQGSNWSTITYRQEPTRSWDRLVKVAVRNPSTVLVTVLDCSRGEVDKMRRLGKVHTGYARDMNGEDKGLLAAMCRPISERPEALRQWVDRWGRREAAAFEEAACGLWLNQRADELREVARLAGIEIVETPDARKG